MGCGWPGNGTRVQSVSLVVLSDADDASQGAAAASLQLTDVLGIALGTGIGGALVAVAPSLAWTRRDALAVVFATMLGAAMTGVALARRLRADPRIETPAAAPDVLGVPSPGHGDSLP